MKYNITRPEGMPEWCEIGVHVRAWNEKKYRYIEGVFVGYDERSGELNSEFYIEYKENNSVVKGWFWNAEPIPEWEPEVGEPVAWWNHKNCDGILNYHRYYLEFHPSKHYAKIAEKKDGKWIYADWLQPGITTIEDIKKNTAWI